MPHALPPPALSPKPASKKRGTKSAAADETVSPAVERVREMIAMLAKWLPEQRPLSVFVHANPLELLEGQPFHAACEAATRIRGAKTTLSAARYRELVEERHIRPEDVAAAKARIAALRLHRIDALLEPAAGTVLLSRVRPEMAVEVGEMVDAVLLRILPPFLDLGSALWPMPKRDQGLLGVLRHLARVPLGIPEPWLSGLSRRLGDPTSDPMALLIGCLEKRGDKLTGWPHVIHEALFALPGYAGMIQRLEHHAHEQPKDTRISLEDYLAARLVIEELALEDITRRLFGRKATLSTLAMSMTASPKTSSVPWTEELAAFQDAYEEDYVRSLIGAMSMQRQAPRPSSVEDEHATNVHFVCCIDDRLESIRRHVEECVPNAQTIGSAGFFGVALKHRSPLNCDETPSCPAPVTPEKRVTEVLDAEKASALQRVRSRSLLFSRAMGDDASRSAPGGVLASLANLVRAPRTVIELLFPQLFIDPAHEFEGSRLVYAKDEDPEGFTLQDQINLVHRNLATTGLVSGFGRWVLIIGHGSKGVNNPFLSGYQCGACGGQRGGINARVFCAFANDPKVREGIAALGIEIPEETYFQPGEHDTSLDHIRWFDLDRVPADRKEELADLHLQLEIALGRNAKERARRFADVPLNASIEETLARVQRRTADFAETRPEYNHATNAACIIGRRALTKGLFLDRRSFLVSYDPAVDDAGHAILERIMAAPLPVCAGISHEYFFSTMDTEKFGSGTKLPHNVQGLIGVSNGADGDLRPGLWTQTTEIHEPIRLVTVIDAEPEAITTVLGRLPNVKRGVVNGWIHLFACSPSDRGFFRWVGEGFEPYAAPPHALYEVAGSLDACTHTRGNVAPCLVLGRPGDEPTQRDGEEAA
jgi:uncharacterized protein YbcC (UPF0753/DUF2309 family)